MSEYNVDEEEVGIDFILALIENLKMRKKTGNHHTKKSSPFGFSLCFKL